MLQIHKKVVHAPCWQKLSSRPICRPTQNSVCAAGKSASIDDFMREVLEDNSRALLRDLLSEGITELDAGLGVESSPEELMAEVRAEAGIAR